MNYVWKEEILGKGAMKTVYKAIDELLGIGVAWNQVKLNEVFRSPKDLQRLAILKNFEERGKKVRDFIVLIWKNFREGKAGKEVRDLLKIVL